MTEYVRYPILETPLLIVVVVTCWVGVLGMRRMREPVQALHYLALPGSVGVIALAIAAFLETGSSQIAWKTALISCLLFAINAVGTHATARAFRARELGHWEPRDGDPIEFTRDDRSREESR
ncbi:MAG: hypothetical protein NVSMB62_17480 [Acidobacteriaceae bacterium]